MSAPAPVPPRCNGTAALNALLNILKKLSFLFVVQSRRYFQNFQLRFSPSKSSKLAEKPLYSTRERSTSDIERYEPAHPTGEKLLLALTIGLVKTCVQGEERHADSHSVASRFLASMSTIVLKPSLNQ